MEIEEALGLAHAPIHPSGLNGSMIEFLEGDGPGVRPKGVFTRYEPPATSRKGRARRS